MVRSRRESHHSDGITDPKGLQLPFATKSGPKRTFGAYVLESAFGGKADIEI
jgi:hypothetical protein